MAKSQGVFAVPDLNTYYERIAGRSPSKVGFSRRGGGRGVMQIAIGDMGGGETPITAGTQVHDAIKECFGFTVPHPDGIRLQRTLPKAFPLTPWLFVDSMGEITGEGRMTQVPTDPSLEASSFDNAAFYPTQEFSLEFKPVMYSVLSDDSIPVGTIDSWVDDTGTTQNNGGNGFSYAEEWLRYTDIIRNPAVEFITAQMGNFLFDCPTASPPNGQPAGDGQLKMLMQKIAIQIVWSEVPYEYVDSVGPTGVRIASNIDKGIGHINQFDWFGFPKGTLLLLGVNVVRYPQIVPDYAYGNDSTAFTAKKLCDITFNCLYTNPTIGVAAAAPINGNVIQAGHNLIPWAHSGLYYFGKSGPLLPVVARGRGVFPSFPYEFLFSNPGV